MIVRSDPLENRPPGDPYLERLFAGEWKQGGVPPLWDGKAGERIVAILNRLLREDKDQEAKVPEVCAGALESCSSQEDVTR